MLTMGQTLCFVLIFTILSVPCDFLWVPPTPHLTLNPLSLGTYSLSTF